MSTFMWTFLAGSNLVLPYYDWQGPTATYGSNPFFKPLLELRSDLVLVGRMLLVRPVRHLLRGAYFDRTSDKYRLRVYQFVHPLCCYQSPYAYGGELQVPTMLLILLALPIWWPQREAQ
jgi:hypothetical protein